jgi:hypothetical protein
MTPSLHSPARSPPGHATKTCTALQELCFAGLCQPALDDLCFASHALKACTGLQDHCSVGMHPKACHVGDPNLHNLCPPRPAVLEIQTARSLFRWATRPRPTQPYTIFTPQACARRPDKPGTHTPTISILLDHAPPSLSSQGFTDTQDLHSTGLRPSGMPSPRSKGHYFTSAKGLHPKACGTPPTFHWPQEGSKAT